MSKTYVVREHGREVCDTPLRYGRLGRTWICPVCQQVWFVGRDGGHKAWIKHRPLYYFDPTLAARVDNHDDWLMQHGERLTALEKKGKKR